MNQFAEPPATISHITISSCDATAIRIAINVTAHNIGHAGLDGIGALNLSMYHEQNYVGYAVSSVPEEGVPRGTSDQLFDVVIANTTANLPRAGKMIKALVTGRAQFFLTGQQSAPFSSQVALLQEPLKQLNVSILYTDGLKKVTLNPKCDLIPLITLAA